MTNVLVKNGRIVGLTELNELQGYEILSAPKGWDGNLERLRYRKGKVELISEEEYLKEKKKKVLRLRKKQVSKATERYIETKLEEIDENLSDITSEVFTIEGEILLIAGIEGIELSIDEVKQKVAMFIAGKYTEEDAIKELKEKGLSENGIKEIIGKLQRSVEIAKMLTWKENIWKIEEHLEEKLEKKTLEELEKLDIEKYIEEAYKDIPLEV